MANHKWYMTVRSLDADGHVPFMISHEIILLSVIILALMTIY